jgi:hypothetical protein
MTGKRKGRWVVVANDLYVEMAPQVRTQMRSTLPNVFALFCILLEILPGWRFTPFTLSTPSAPHGALVGTGIERPINRHIQFRKHQANNLACNRVLMP